MKKVFQDAKDKYVAATIVFYNSTDSKFYEDEAFTTEVSADDLKDLFYKNLIAVKDGVSYTAKSMSAAGEINFGFSA